MWNSCKKIVRVNTLIENITLMDFGTKYKFVDSGGEYVTNGLCWIYSLPPSIQ